MEQDKKQPVKVIPKSKEVAVVTMDVKDVPELATEVVKEEVIEPKVTLVEDITPEIVEEFTDVMDTPAAEVIKDFKIDYPKPMYLDADGM